MVKKIMIYLVSFVVLIFILSTLINWYITRPIKYDDKICLKNKLLTQWEDDPQNIYIQIKGFRCEIENDILILEEIGK